MAVYVAQKDARRLPHPGQKIMPLQCSVYRIRGALLCSVIGISFNMTKIMAIDLFMVCSIDLSKRNYAAPFYKLYSAISKRIFSFSHGNIKYAKQCKHQLHTNTHAHTNTHRHTYIDKYTHTHANNHSQTHGHTQTHKEKQNKQTPTQTFKHKHAQTLSLSYIHPQTHTHAHTHIHKHTHT